MVETIKPTQQLYPPSWVDRLQMFIERQSGPYWSYYLAAWAILFGLAAGAQWLTDSRTPLPAWLTILLVSWWPVFLFWGMHYLDLYAASAFEVLEPSLKGDEQSRGKLKYRLTTLPARLALWISLIYALINIINDSRQMQPHNVSEMIAIIVYLFIRTLGNTVSAAFIYHAIHQLSAIRTIYAACEIISPLRPYDLYALSGLALRNAFIMISVTYIFYFTNSDQNRFDLLVQVVIPVSLLAGILFVAPLLGVHQMLLKEKNRLHSQAAEQLEAVIEELHQKVKNKQFDSIDGPNKAISGLQTELNILDKTTTWPWQPDAPRWLLTAILLPVTVWLLQRLLGKFL
jgi:hypothetical protein